MVKGKDGSPARQVYPGLLDSPLFIPAIHASCARAGGVGCGRIVGGTEPGSLRCSSGRRNGRNLVYFPHHRGLTSLRKTGTE